MLTTIIAFITRNLKSLGIGIGIALIILTGVFIKGCDYGKSLSSEKIIALNKEIAELRTLSVETREESKPAPITFKPVEGKGRGRNKFESEFLKAEIFRLLNERKAIVAEKEKDKSKMEQENIALRQMNTELAAPFEAQFDSSLMANDSIDVPFTLNIKAYPLNRLSTRNAIYYLLSLSKMDWSKLVVTNIQRIPLERGWWEYVLYVGGLVVMFLLGRI